MDLTLQLTELQARGLRHALAQAAEHPDYDDALEPIWRVLGDYCQQQDAEACPTAHHPCTP